MGTQRMTNAAPATTPTCIWKMNAQLGEGPLWMASERALYFVDIMGMAIHRWDDEDHRQTWATTAEPGFIVPCAHGGFVCGMRGGLHRFYPPTGRFALLVSVDIEKPRHRINDGFVDYSGRLWFGTMYDDAHTQGGALYSLERNLKLRTHDAGYIVTNGPVMSPDGATLYHNDSDRQTVYAFDHRAGELSNKRVFISFSAGVFPDGMAVDTMGHLWIALFNGWRIERYSPLGEKVDEIRFPCANPTKPAFGGEDLRTLFVTSASAGLTLDELSRQPLAGSLFAVRVAIPGLPPNPARWE